jgi:hypothetical protein
LICAMQRLKPTVRLIFLHRRMITRGEIERQKQANTHTSACSIQTKLEQSMLVSFLPFSFLLSIPALHAQSSSFVNIRLTVEQEDTETILGHSLTKEAHVLT